MGYYPLMLNLSEKPCIVIGGGPVAQRKAEGLIEAGARVTLVSPGFTPRLEQLAETAAVNLLRQAYREGMPELREAVLVYAATGEAEINAAVRLEAEALGKLVTVADDPARSGFIVPAVVRRGKLQIAVSTEGASPAVAKRVRQELEAAFGEEYETYLDVLQELRSFIKQLISSTAERQDLYKRMLDWELLPWIRSGHFDGQARRELLERVAAEPTAAGMARLGDWIGGFGSR